MADDEQLVQCPYCDDNSSRCDRYPKLDGDEETYLSLTLRRDFEKIMVYTTSASISSFLFKHASYLNFCFDV